MLKRVNLKKKEGTGTHKNTFEDWLTSCNQIIPEARVYDDVTMCSCPEVLYIGLPLLAVCFNQVGQCGSHVYEYIDNIAVAVLPCRHITRTHTHCRGRHHQIARLWQSPFNCHGCSGDSHTQGAHHPCVILDYELCNMGTTKQWSHKCPTYVAIIPVLVNWLMSS